MIGAIKGPQEDAPMTEVQRFVVLRAHPDLPAGFLPPEMEGRWYGEELLPEIESDGKFPLANAVAVRTERFERRDDGATARVYEIRP